MNPFSKLSYTHLPANSFDESLSLLQEKLEKQKFSCVVYGLESSFEEGMKINDFTKSLGIPFYCLNSSGLNAFMFSDLATDSFEFQHTVKDKEGVNQLLIGKTEGSQTFRAFTETILDIARPLKWTKRDVAKPEKLLFLAIIKMILESQDKALTDFLSSKAGLSGLKDKILESQSFKEVSAKFEQCFKRRVQFNPASGVIGAMASQEIIKVITRKDMPTHGLFLYDANSQKIVIEKAQ